MECDVTCHMVLSQDGHINVTVTVTRSCDAYKVREGSRTNVIV